MKRRLLLAGCVGLVLGIAGFLLRRSAPTPGPSDVAALIAAVQAFGRAQVSPGAPLPATVSARQLVESGFLSSKVWQRFGAIDFTIPLASDETRPQSVLTSVRLADGGVLVVAADGSTHRMSGTDNARDGHATNRSTERP